MIKRIVKLTIEEEKCEDFIHTFMETRQKVRNFYGCKRLELLRDKNNPNIFITYSFWADAKDLEHYRNSDLFKGVWKNVKPWFAGKAEAYSTESLATLD